LQGPGDVLVRVTAVGICASDVKMYKGSDFYWGKGRRAIVTRVVLGNRLGYPVSHAAGGRCSPGVVPGHEFVGVVEALGVGSAELYGLAVGDQVCPPLFRPDKISFGNSLGVPMSRRLLSSCSCAKHVGSVCMGTTISVMR
jgi:threonine dehydrogenase-like Zn-dependent dehydrogenase